MHKAVGILSVDGQSMKPERAHDARDDQGLLRDVRRAVPVRRHLDRRARTPARSRSWSFRARSTRSCSAARTASAGAIRWNDNEFRIVGVRDHWMPLPTFYDVNNDALEEPEDVYIPFGWSVALELDSAGNTNGWKPEDIKTYQQFLNSEVIWIQMWVELPDEASRNRFQAFIDNYATRAEAAGRYQRPLNNRLTKVDQWLVDNDVVGNDDRVLVGLAFAFLAVCLLNTVGPAAGEVPERRLRSPACAARSARAASRCSTSTSSRWASSPRSARCSASRSGPAARGPPGALYGRPDGRRRHAGDSRTWTSRAW